MEKINGCELYYFDEAVEKLSEVRKWNPHVPVFKGDTDQIAAFVYYEKGFHLWVFIYCAAPHDPGLIAAHIKYFAARKVNLLEFPWDPEPLIKSIEQQITDIATEINYKFTIARVEEPDFVGFRILQKSIEKERTNSDGHLN